MDKDQEILAVSRLVFELTRLDDVDADLDQLLRRLFKLLRTLPAIRVLPKSAIQLLNSQQRLVQVAQFGLPPIWRHGLPPPPHAAYPDPASEGRSAYLGSLASHLPTPAGEEAMGNDAPCFVLPLRADGQLLGRVLLLIDPDWVPDAIETEFMTDLADALSVLVWRCRINETLSVREVELEDARSDAIRRLGTASEYRDNETGMHVMRMAHYAVVIAKAMGLSSEEREILSICAPMHDVGKIGIADAILLKPGRLTSDEFSVMKTHTEIGKRLLLGEELLITAARDIATCHHERWDGMGYPEGLAAEQIPLLARVCAVADVFDALTSVRPYKRPWPIDVAADWIFEQSGKHFDPDAVAAFGRAMPEILRIRELYRDDIIDPNQVLSLPQTAVRESAWIKWNDEEFSVRIDVIDEHHRYLFDLTNDLFDVVTGKQGVREVIRVLKALDQYAQAHFRAEERMMAHYGYVALARQQHQHKQFEARLREFYAKFHESPLTTPFDVLVYLRDWLTHHILREDAQLKALVTGGADSAGQGWQ